MYTVGFVGLGKMGWPMAGRLVDAGFPVTVLDANEAAAARFVQERGGRRASTLRDVAAASDVVITMLPNGEVVRRVVLGSGDGTEAGLLAGMRPGSILVDMSSSDPVGTRSLGQICRERGVAMVDAPVSGGVPRAVAGTLAIMAGGDAEVIDKLEPIFSVLGQRVFRTGPLGSGHAMKALNNFVSAAGLIAAAEALLVGRAFGLDPNTMIDVLNASTGRNNSTENKFKQYILSRTFNSGFTLDLMLKDLTMAVDLARKTGTPALFASACRELWAAARSCLEPGADHTAVVQWLEQLAGVTLESGRNESV
ncbi:MAG TPA: NAD(P)-dependent oxidoreductase [Limnochordales bacterium]